MRVRAALALAVTLASSPLAAAEVAEVLAIRGSASLVAEGRAVPLAVGTPIPAGAVIRTASPGRLKLRFVDGSVVVIGDDTTFSVEGMQLAPGGGRKAADFVLDVGLISQRVAPGGGGWTVRTPTAVTAVRGTEFVVEVAANRSTEVNVRSGVVSVTPAAAPKGMRLPVPPPDAADAVVLDRSRLGTSCDALSYRCAAARAWSDERMKALDDRLSGV